MSTIKSQTEHLTLNADGTGKEIKFQANGVEKASISSTGAFTSTTIDATKLSGALPAIDGSALTGDVGKVLQVVNIINNTYTTTTATGWTAVGTTISITPTSTSSKVEITHTASGIYDGSGKSVGIRLLRGSTVIMQQGRWAYAPVGGTHYQGVNWSFSFVDTPSTTNSTSYSIEITGEGNNVRYGDSDSGNGTNISRSNITAMEIAQ